VLTYTAFLPLGFLNPDNHDPNGRYWQEAAVKATADLQRHLGDELYWAWVRRIWPGDSFHRLSWQQICRHADAAYELATIHQNRDLEKLLEASRGATVIS